MSIAEERPLPPHLPRSASQPKPKGILKNAPQTPGVNGHLQWDEENIAATEIGKDSLMKITEPKTPYVRYNAETDTIEGDIPNLDLGHRAVSPLDVEDHLNHPNSPVMTLSPTGADTSGPSSRRTSFSSNGGRPGTSMSHRSGSSSRSTSFNLPNEARNVFGADGKSPGEEVEFEEEMDEETAKKHAEFVRARGRHYSNEAEAMKRAQQLLDDEEEEESAIPPVPRLPTTDYSAENTDESGTEASESSHAASKINGIGHRGT